MIEVRCSTAAETEALRRRVLRPGSSGPLPGDDGSEVVFFSAYDGAVVASTGNVRPAAAPFPVEGPPWRLRGMATAPDRRGEGLGAAVLAALVAHCEQQGGAVLWANARTPALAFYERAGFTTWGEAWEAPQIGPHVVIRLGLLAGVSRRPAPG